MLTRHPTIITIACLLLVGLPAWLGASYQNPVTGSVKDPTGAVVVGALVTAKSEATGATVQAITDSQGLFTFKGLADGKYNLRIAATGFKAFELNITVGANQNSRLDVKLEIAETRAEIGVNAKGPVGANTDLRYRAERDATFDETLSVNNLTLKRDVGTITLRSGTISFLQPVLGKRTIGVFVGDGVFTLQPAIPSEAQYLRFITNKDSVEEQFEKLVLCFTDQTYEEIKSASTPTGVDAHANAALADFRKRVRYRTERPRSLLEFVLAYESVENIEASVLADLYNPRQAGFFNAYINGKKHSDMRFRVCPRGALPQFQAPEEVALLNLDPGGKEEGVLYLAHFENEYKNGTASSNEDKRVIHAEHYRIETVVEKGDKLVATAEITFTPVTDGDRLITFGLLPNLRVTRVSLDNEDIGYLQEKIKEDGSFHVIMPAPMVKGQTYKMVIEYGGSKVVTDAGGGNFYVAARTSWYPSVNAFADQSTFDLTFKVPKKFTLVGVGKPTKQWTEGDYAASQWVSDVPLAVAGFNYGLFKKQETTDESIHYQIEGYATSDLPDNLKGAEAIGGMTPTRLTQNAMVEAENAMRIYTQYFGPAPYGRIAITQQPDLNFGQSWPTLVYLPIIAFFDSTQRHMLMGGRNSTGLSNFILELTPHEVSHQWWGHMVGWASFHDQWLSEGFADFSAGLYLQKTEKKPDVALHYWDRQREDILRKSSFGVRMNDAGPVWQGLRLDSYKAPGAYNYIVYPKGGYVLYMLQKMMWDNQSGDQRFIAMMHDFVKTYMYRSASTEDFKKMVEKYMRPGMDLDGNKRMDWFFNDWIYGTDLPSYKFEYTVTPDADGKFLLQAKLTQSGVSDNFKMLVPIYAEFDGQIVRLGDIAITGNKTLPELKVKLPKKPTQVLINANRDILTGDNPNGK